MDKSIVCGFLGHSVEPNAISVKAVNAPDIDGEP